MSVTLGYRSSTDRASSPTAILSTRERDVLRLMAEGLSNAGISRRMYLSTKTVEDHIGSIFTKLGLFREGTENRRVQAVLIWISAAEIDGGLPDRPERGLRR